MGVFWAPRHAGRAWGHLCVWLAGPAASQALTGVPISSGVSSLPKGTHTYTYTHTHAHAHVTHCGERQREGGAVSERVLSTSPASRSPVMKLSGLSQQDRSSWGADGRRVPRLPGPVVGSRVWPHAPSAGHGSSRELRLQPHQDGTMRHNYFSSGNQ